MFIIDRGGSLRYRVSVTIYVKLLVLCDEQIFKCPFEKITFQNVIIELYCLFENLKQSKPFFQKTNKHQTYFCTLT